MASCSSDDNIEKKESPTEAIDLARNFLTGDVVLSTHATLNGVNKTLLPTDSTLLGVQLKSKPLP